MKKQILVFFACLFTVASILFLIPINLFDGEITYNVLGRVFTVPAKLSLSYFIGIGSSPEDTKDVVSFRLLPMGYFLATLMLVGLPLLLTYRITLKKITDNK